MRRAFWRWSWVAAVVGVAGLAVLTVAVLRSGGDDDAGPQDDAGASTDAPATTPTSPDGGTAEPADTSDAAVPAGAYEEPAHDHSIEIEAADDAVVVTIANTGDAVAPRVPLSVVVFDATGTRPTGSIDPTAVDHPTGCVAYRGSTAGVYCPGGSLALAPGESIQVTIPLADSGTYLVRAALDWGLEASHHPLSARFDADPSNDLVELLVRT